MELRERKDMSCDWISKNELGRRLGVSCRTIERWSALGAARAVMGRTVFYDYPVVLGILAARRGLSLGASRARRTVTCGGSKTTNKGKVRNDTDSNNQ